MHFSPLFLSLSLFLYVNEVKRNHPDKEVKRKEIRINKHNNNENEMTNKGKTIFRPQIENAPWERITEDNTMNAWTLSIYI